MLDIFKEKVKETNIDKYGVDHISKNEIFRKKYKMVKNSNYIQYIENGISLFNCEKGYTFSISSDNLNF
jgi:hypothetical protein